METGLSSRTAVVLRYLLLFLAVLFIVTYLLVALLRMGYPFELEWMEGASVDHVMRVISGEKLYVAPSLDFVPFIYTPLYFYVSALVSKVVGTGFFPLRLLSFLSSLGCFLIIFLWVRRETKSGFAAIIASSLFAATFRISGAWFDVGRADSLFLLLLLGGLYLLRFKSSARWYLLAGLLISLAFLTKQMTLVVFLFVAAYCFLMNRGRCIYFIGTVIFLVGASTFLLNRLHDGWYTYYVFDLPSQHALLRNMWTDFWTADIMSVLSVALIASLFYLVVRTADSDKKKHLFYILMLAGTIVASWLSRVHPGGYVNVLFPAYAALSILFGLAIHRVFEYVRSLPADRRGLIANYVYVICIIQFSLLAYNPFAQVPGKKDLEAGQAFIDAMRELPGDVLVPYHGYLPSLAGKSCCAHEAAVNDILKADDGPVKAGLLDEINQALRERKFNCIVLNAPWFPELTEKNYVRWRPVFDKQDVFWPPTGFQTRPELIFVARTDGAK
jgi:4-amino-4-deoxy-L-arabinose transferase-like glycosyltransferase